MAIVGKGATIGKQYWVARDILREVEVSIKMIDGRLVVIGLCKDKYRRFSIVFTIECGFVLSSAQGEHKN